MSLPDAIGARFARVMVWAALVGALLSGTSALACTTCQCGATPSAALPVGAPSAGGWRMVVETGYQNLRTGTEGFDEIRVYDARLNLAFAWMSRAGWGAGAQLPVVVRQTTLPSGVTEGGVALSDLTVFAERRLLAPWASWAGVVSAGLRLPTSMTLRDAAGDPINLDGQPGVAAWTPYASIFFQGLRTRYRPMLSASAFAPARSRHDFQPGLVGLASLGVVRSFGRATVQLTADSRLESPDRFDTPDGTESDPNSGGFTLFVSPSVWYAASDAVTVGATVRAPVVQPTRGDQHEGPIVQLTVLIQGRRSPRRAPTPDILTQRDVTNALLPPS